MINILVVEDDVKLNYIICAFLNDKGYHAISCKNGNDAYDQILEGPVDLIFRIL